MLSFTLPAPVAALIALRRESVFEDRTVSSSIDQDALIALGLGIEETIRQQYRMTGHMDRYKFESVNPSIAGFFVQAMKYNQQFGMRKRDRLHYSIALGSRGCCFAFTHEHAALPPDAAVKGNQITGTGTTEYQKFMNELHSPSPKWFSPDLLALDTDMPILYSAVTLEKVLKGMRSS